MKKICIIISLLIMVTGLSVPSHAALEDRGNGLVYDTVLNVTWLKNANLASQLTFGVAGIFASGQMGGPTAQAWIEAMNAAKYLGYSNWRLPQTLPVNGSSFNYAFTYNGSSDLGYNISAPGSAYPSSTASELAYNYYVNLGDIGAYDINGNSQKNYGVTNQGPFFNLAYLPGPFALTPFVIYWSGSNYSGPPTGPNDVDMWSFRYDYGYQYVYDNAHAFYAWPVLPGDPAYPGTAPQPPPTVNNVVFAVRSGGGSYASESGFVYQADTDYTGGATYSTTAAITVPPSDSTVAVDSPVYQSDRYGNFSYSIPLANGNYTVILKFAETYWNAVGKRVFNVSMQNQQVISNLDIYAAVGNNAFYDVSVPVVVTNNMLNINFSSIKDYACVSAIVVTATPNAALLPDTTPPTVPTGLAATLVTSAQVNLAWAASTDPVVPGQVTSGLAGYNVYRNGAPIPIGSTPTPMFSDTTVSASTSYTYSVSAYDNAGNDSVPSKSLPVTTLSPGSTTGNVVFAINSGGGLYTSPSSGIAYQADTDYSGGSTYSTTAAITGTFDQPLYQSQRYGDLTYNIPLPNGNYNVTLKFAELYFNSAGQRKFDVSMEGQQVIANLDVYSAAGGENAAYDVTTPVNVTNGVNGADGVLTIAFTPVINYPIVNAIEITQGPTLPPPTTFFVNSGGAPFTDTSGNVYQADVDYSGGSTYSTTAAITGTPDQILNQPLYQSQRYGNFSYSVPLANGDYNVTLKFAELYFNSAGQRVFDVSMQGQQVITNLDVYSAAGGENAAYDVTTPVSVTNLTNGMLTITFDSVTNYAIVNAIEITPK